MWEGSGVWIGQTFKVQDSHGASGGDAGLQERVLGWRRGAGMSEPATVYMFLCPCSAGPALPSPLTDPGPWATRACCLGHPRPHTPL